MSKDFLWIIPFLCFCGGYYATRSFFYIAQFPAPSVVGSSLYQAVTVLSNHHLSVKLLAHKQDSDLPAATVLSQRPSAGHRVKPRQTIFLTVSQPPPLPIAPAFQGKSLEQIEREIKQLNLKLKPYYLESSYPRGTCIAQNPAPGHSITEHSITVYIAQPILKPVIWPDFKGKLLSDALQLLEPQEIPVKISSSSGCTEPESTVIDQRPLAGSLIFLDSSQPISVQLHVQ